MDGQNRTKLVDSKIVFPHGITLDLVNRMVYWADAYLDYIEVVDYEGKNRHTIIQGLLVRIGGCTKLPTPPRHVQRCTRAYRLLIGLHSFRMLNFAKQQKPEFLLSFQSSF